MTQEMTEQIAGLEERISRLEERNGRLEFGLSALAGEVTRNFPIRNRPPGEAELSAIFKEVQERVQADAATARRHILENELAELGSTA